MLRRLSIELKALSKTLKDLSSELSGLTILLRLLGSEPKGLTVLLRLLSSELSVPASPLKNLGRRAGACSTQAWRHFSAAASYASRASTQRPPSGVSSFFQKGARVLR